MDVHEYQAKELLSSFGVAIPRGGVVYSPDQAVYRAAEIGGSRWPRPLRNRTAKRPGPARGTGASNRRRALATRP